MPEFKLTHCCASPANRQTGMRSPGNDGRGPNSQALKKPARLPLHEPHGQFLDHLQYRDQQQHQLQHAIAHCAPLWAAVTTLRALVSASMTSRPVPRQQSSEETRRRRGRSTAFRPSSPRLSAKGHRPPDRRVNAAPSNDPGSDCAANWLRAVSLRPATIGTGKGKSIDQGATPHRSSPGETRQSPAVRPPLRCDYAGEAIRV